MRKKRNRKKHFLDKLRRGTRQWWETSHVLRLDRLLITISSSFGLFTPSTWAAREHNSPAARALARRTIDYIPRIPTRPEVSAFSRFAADDRPLLPGHCGYACVYITRSFSSALFASQVWDVGRMVLDLRRLFARACVPEQL